ncbi:MAG: DEAD/DEAH box helicase, partial [Planctomycetia bacterium]
LEKMLRILHDAGYVVLDPPPPPKADGKDADKKPADLKPIEPPAEAVAPTLNTAGLFGGGGAAAGKPAPKAAPAAKAKKPADEPEEETPGYESITATPTPAMDRLLAFRSVHPLYGAFLVDQLGIADKNERLQALESVLEVPRPLLRFMRVPEQDELPAGPLATTRLDEDLIRRGLMLAKVPPMEGEEEEEDDEFEERPPTLAEKLRLLFDAKYPELAGEVTTQAVWAAGELLRFGGDFNKYVRSRDLAKQEGIVFRHMLRLILLCGEFSTVMPPDGEPEQWREDLREFSEKLTESCRVVDPTSTDEVIERSKAADVVAGETTAKTSISTEPPPEEDDAFGEGLFDGDS